MFLESGESIYIGNVMILVRLVLYNYLGRLVDCNGSGCDGKEYRLAYVLISKIKEAFFLVLWYANVQIKGMWDLLPAC